MSEPKHGDTITVRPPEPYRVTTEPVIIDAGDPKIREATPKLLDHAGVVLSQATLNAARVVEEGSYLGAWVRNIRFTLHDPANPLFGEFRIEVPPAPKAVEMAVPDRVPVAVAETGVTEEYAALCKRIGFEYPGVLQRELELFLAENFIPVYPIASVQAYMDNLMLKLRETSSRWYSWHWTPLRECDRLMSNRGDDTHELGTDSRQSYASSSTYEHPIPMPVLETVARISDHFGERVGLFVSDYDEQSPDPFLMVTAPGLPAYVIEYWDEPGFRAYTR